MDTTSFETALDNEAVNGAAKSRKSCRVFAKKLFQDSFLDLGATGFSPQTHKRQPTALL
jgi:hypothetical protein